MQTTSCQCPGCRTPELPQTRRCVGCHFPRPLGWFCSNGGGLLRARCRECLRGKRSGDNAKRRARVEGGERVTTADIAAINARQNYVCACGCGESTRWEYHVDHRIALARGGTHTLNNLQILYPLCNLRKGSK
jgi:5-methylcytosine-specific restriction endonuclease McrA